MRTFAIPFGDERDFYREIIDKTERKVQGSKYKRASVSLEKLRSVRGKLRIIEYTMKSLILAQDER